MKCPHCEIDKTKDILFIMIGYRGKDSKSVDFGKIVVLEDYETEDGSTMEGKNENIIGAILDTWAAAISSKMSGKSQDRFIKSMKDKNIL